MADGDLESLFIQKVRKAPRMRLVDFVRQAWPHIERKRYRHSKLIEVICEKLEAVTRGEIRELVINVPPGHMKSLLVSVFWPAWEWTLNQGESYLVASFDQVLVNRDAGKVMRLVQTDWYRSRWPRVSLVGSRPAVTFFHTTEGGFRFSTTVRGKATGHHPTRIIIDDPTKPGEVIGSITAAALDECKEWFEGTISSRGERTEVAIVLIMQRIHDDDLAAICIALGFDTLILPMEFEPENADPRDWRTTEGEVLWPERFPPEEVMKLKLRLGDNYWFQYQQKSVAAKGTIVRGDWIVHEDSATFPTVGSWCMSFDFAFKKLETSDFVAGGVWLAGHDGRFYQYLAFAERLSFTESVDRVREWSAAFPHVYEKLVEDKANGTAIEDVLRDEIDGIELVEPQGSKPARLHSVAPLFRARRVVVPLEHQADWVPVWKRQVTRFPAVKNDDLVDQTTQALIHLHQGGEAFHRAMERLRSGI